jgi:serine/threonine protein kinase
VILYVLTCGKVPFDDAYLPALNQKIMNGQVDYPSHLSPNIKNLLSKMLVVKPFKRATIEQIKAHPWFVKGCKFNSFLPERKKIEHIDDEVVKRMGGFRFGSEDKIKEKLAVDIMSDELEPIVSIYRLVSEKMQRPDYKYKIANPTRIVSAEVLDKESKKKLKSKVYLY